MGSYKGYSLFVSASSTESEGYHFRIPKICLIPLWGIVALITSVFFYSLFGFAKLTMVEVQLKQQRMKRTSAGIKIEALDTEAEVYRKTINRIVSEDSRRRISYGLSPLDRGVLQAGIGGTPLKSTEAIENFEHRYIVDALKLHEEFQLFSRQSILVDSTLERVKNHIEKEQARLRETPSIWPTEGRKTSKYGSRFHPVLRKKVFHDGLDIANRKWTPVIAPADGVCEKAHNSRGGYGKVIKLSHSASGYKTRYAHLADMVVKSGQVVKRGELIGYLGNTGRSTGPHLHYEVIRNGRTLNPEKFLLDKVAIQK